MSTCVDTFWRFFVPEIDDKFDFACKRELTRKSMRRILGKSCLASRVRVS